MIKEITGFSGYYISDDGKVFSTKKGEMKELRLQTNRKGYLTVWLCRDGVIKALYVHRLVATAFIPNPENLSDVNHKNEIKDDNRVENLEWCNHRYNLNWGTRNERVSEAHKTSPKVRCVELDITFDNYKACNDYMAKYLGIKQFNVGLYLRKYEGHYQKRNLTFIELPSQDSNNS